jgi:hypothetical protein
MSDWLSRSREERSLLNPGFCSLLLWKASVGHASVHGVPISLEETFLVLPVVLDRRTREALPRDIRTSLAAWVDSDPLVANRIAKRAHLLTAFTKESLLFGGVHGLISIRSGKVVGEEKLSESVKSSLRSASEEVQQCAKKAEFIGKWFAHVGAPATVLALVGVRP